MTETIYGNLQGLKPNQLKQLRRLYHQRLPGDVLLAPDFAERLAAIAGEIDTPVCAYLNRRGQVIRVGVGTPHQTQIPAWELPRYGMERLSGIRCAFAQVKSEPPNEAALTAMVLMRLDALMVLNVSRGGFTKRGGGMLGFIEGTYLANLTPHPEMDWAISPLLEKDLLCDRSLAEVVDGIEREFADDFVARRVDADKDRVLVVGLHTAQISDDRFRDGIEELVRLVDTAGGEVLHVMQQKRSRRDPQTVVGSGKVQEIALAAQKCGANLIVFDCNLTSSQSRNLENTIGTRVVDRTEVILDIFAQRARSGEGKLQVELAQLEYMLPRLVGRGREMSRLGGGIGTRGPGETKLETERRAIQKRLSHLQREVDRLQAHRARLRQQRQHREVPSVALMGYTNAGKSTLLNALTNAETYTADRLFATLDPTTRRLAVPVDNAGTMRQILLTDTVGFIHELPPALLDAFRATIEEVTEADAAIHLVDLSHPAWQSHIRAVMKILQSLPFAMGPSAIVFNKIDRVDRQTLEFAVSEFPNATFIAAAEKIGLERLRHRIAHLLSYSGAL
jgi:GTP-binding protein HflX